MPHKGYAVELFQDEQGQTQTRNLLLLMHLWDFRIHLNHKNKLQ